MAPTVETTEIAKANNKTIFFNMVRSFRGRQSDSLPGSRLRRTTPCASWKGSPFRDLERQPNSCGA